MSKHIQAAIKKALAPNNKALKVRKRKQPNLNPDSKTNSVLDLNAELVLAELMADPNIKNELVAPYDNKAKLGRETDKSISETDLVALRKTTDPYGHTKNKVSQQERRETNIKGSRADSAEIMYYEIDMINDSDLVVLIKREINRMKITANDIYELIGTEECPFLLRKNDGWNLIYSLRTRSHITYENALKWSVILNKQLITFVVDDTEFEEFSAVITKYFPHLYSA